LEDRAFEPTVVTRDIRKGFVWRTVPHIMLKSISTNPDIKDGMSRDEIDAAVARYADREVLYDQPYEDKKRVRVSGRFTVESLSPHRVMPEDEAPPTTETTGQVDGSFTEMVLAN